MTSSAQCPAPSPSTLHEVPATLADEECLTRGLIHARRDLLPVDLYHIAGWLLRHTQNSDVCEWRIKPGVATFHRRIYLTHMAAENDHFCSLLLDTLTVIEVYAAGS